MTNTGGDLSPGARQPCCVPFCKRTTKHDSRYTTWICLQHWRGIPLPTRATYRRAVKSYRRRFGDNQFWAYPAGSPNRLACVDAANAWRDAWESCRVAAIERAAGISG